MQQTLVSTRVPVDSRALVLDAVALLGIWILVYLDAGLDAIDLAAVPAVITLAVLYLGGFHRPRITLSALDQLPRLSAWTTFVSLILYVVLRPDDLWGTLATCAGLVGALCVIRLLYYQWLRQRRASSPAQRSRTVVVGDGVIAAELTKNTRDFPELGLDVVLVVSDDPLPVVFDARVPVISGTRTLGEAVRGYQINTVIIAFSGAPDSGLVSPLRQCADEDCDIFVVPRLFEFMSMNQDMDRIHAIPLRRVKPFAPTTWHWKLKRAFDIVVAGGGLVVMSPLLVAVALSIFLADPRSSIFFRQTRIGRRSEPFAMLKFRSMKPVPVRASDSEWQPTDPDRISPFGRFIRATSIDELPQLLNVLRGDMSMVGPRPERPHFVDEFTVSVPSYRDRHRACVGLTGWAAINGLRGDTSINDRALFDNFYIENWSLWLDIQIILRTIGVVIRRSGS